MTSAEEWWKVKNNARKRRGGGPRALPPRAFSFYFKYPKVTKTNEKEMKSDDKWWKVMTSDDKMASNAHDEKCWKSFDATQLF